MVAAESWPWLADLDQSLLPDKAIDPVNEYDTRESVPELLNEHASNIELVKEALKEDSLYEPFKHDDLWILRFLLSHKHKVKKATKAAKHALQFRNKHKLDEKDLRFIAPHSVPLGEDAPFAGCESLKRAWNTRYPGDCIAFTIPDKQRGVAGFLRFADFKHDKETMKALTDADLAAVFIYLSEWTFQWLDYVTRKTGRLTKSARFTDFTGFSFFQVSRDAIKRDGKIMGEMEDVYPQLLHSLFMYNQPHWIHAIWATMRHIMPSRVVEKVDIVEPKENEKEFKRFLKFVAKEQLPVSLGGDNTVNPAEW